MKQKVSGLQWYQQVRRMLAEFDCMVTTPDADKNMVDKMVTFARHRLCAFMRVNTEYKKYGFYISRGKHGNAIILPRPVVAAFCENHGYNIDTLIESKQITKYTSKEFSNIRHYKNVRQKKFSEYAKKRRMRNNYETIKSSTASEEQKRNAALDIWSEKKIENNEITVTEYENVLYSKLYGVYKKRVRRQQKFIVRNRVYFSDIYMKAYKVVIEVDGGYHNTKSQIEKDKQRDLDLSTLGLLVIRIKNEDVRKRFKMLTSILDKRHKDIIKGNPVSTGTLRL